MNGASAVPCESTISNESNKRMKTRGISQYFFRSVRKLQNSLIKSIIIDIVLILFLQVGRGICFVLGYEDTLLVCFEFMYTKCVFPHYSS